MTFPAPATPPPIVFPRLMYVTTPSMFPSGCVPVASVPMKLPSMWLSTASALKRNTPAPFVAEITFRSAGVTPPMMFPGAAMNTPAVLLPRAQPQGLRLPADTEIILIPAPAPNVPPR